MKRGPRIEIDEGITIAYVADGDSEEPYVEVRDLGDDQLVILWRDDLTKMLDLLDGRHVVDRHGTVRGTPDGPAPSGRRRYRSPAAPEPQPARLMSGELVEFLNGILQLEFDAAKRWLGIDSVFIAKTCELVVRAHGLEERAPLDPQRFHDQIGELNSRLAARHHAGERSEDIPW